MATLLIIDDNETLREGAASVVRKMGHTAVLAASGGEGITQFKAQPPDMILTDLKMEGPDGIEVLDKMRAEDPDAVVMIMTGFGSVKTAVEAMKKGAFDFVEKPFSPDVLRAKVTAGLMLRDERKKMERVSQLADVREADSSARFVEPQRQGERRKVKGILGKSAAMEAVYKAIEKVAATDATVYIHGESGTGKELVARAIHDLSSRRDQPFVGVNCAAIPPTLLESELFGHERGAFTGAIKRKLGRFELAQGGTLFLDEIGDVPLEMQAKLLRALQEKQIERVGGEAPVTVDVRVVSATHRDITTMVKEGSFREDLLYRLHIIPVELPPLRERGEDVALLAQHFLDKLAPRTNPKIRAFDDGCLAALRAYRWPGNVRELENVIEQALVFAEGERLTSDDLPALLGSLKPSAAAPLEQLPPEDDPRTLDEILEGLEKALILRAYQRSHGTKTETARRLGIKTSALYYKLAKYKIE
ncbi:MAG: Fis family transcriptional regulator [Deltaproteobacteria bacterium RBG_16_71_12]|nr:MAG: Fis family transcriptional regulator [Deltaproteobacteria bacterium RBG_16_71_12]